MTKIRKHESHPQGYYHKGKKKYDKHMPAEVKELVDKELVVTVIDISKHFKIDRWCLQDWANQYPEMKSAIDYAKQSFENRLIKSLAAGTYAPGCIFLLKCQYGYLEKEKEMELAIREKEVDAKLANKPDSTTSDITINFIDSPRVED